MSLSLVTLNIERNRHWDRVLPFLARVSPDVICLQEIFEDECEKVERLGYRSLYAHRCMWEKDAHDRGSLASQGVALFSKVPFERSDVYHYFRSKDPGRSQSGARSAQDKREVTDQGVVVATVASGADTFTIATTHFTWTERGEVSPDQESDLVNLLAYLNRFQSLIFTGDLNIPRNRHPLYERLCEFYQDAIPRSITSSIDVDYHMAGKNPERRRELLKTMVDYILTSPHYRVTNISQKCGLSDHCALVAEIEKIKRT